MKKVIITLVFIQLSISAFSQEGVSKKAVYFEMGGAGIAASLNYEQVVRSKNNTDFSIKVGLGYFPLILNNEFTAGTYSTILGANVKKSLNSHSVNLGVSTVFASTIASKSIFDSKQLTYSHLLVPNVGYRYQKPEKNKLFGGIGYSPIISFDGLSIENQIVQFKNHFYILVGINL